MIFYVPIPYEEYWQSANSVFVGKDNFNYEVSGLSDKFKYRFTIAPITIVSVEEHQDIQKLEPRSHALLQHDVNKDKHIDTTKATVAAPTNLTCIGFTDNISISWNAPKSKYRITKYLVNVYDEQGYVHETTYRTINTHIYIPVLISIWCGVRVRASNTELSNVMFLDAGYVLCRAEISSKNYFIFIFL